MPDVARHPAASQGISGTTAVLARPSVFVPATLGRTRIRVGERASSYDHACLTRGTTTP